jgi:hypothetical protein
LALHAVSVRDGTKVRFAFYKSISTQPALVPPGFTSSQNTPASCDIPCHQFLARTSSRTQATSQTTNA